MIAFFSVFNTVTKLIQQFFAAIDYGVYSLVSIVMEGLYNISEVKIFTEGPITDITNRIYVILGIFMLFKMAISMLKGIVNPDSLNDKQAGMQKIIVRVITVLILLMMVPTIFDFAYRVQGNVIRALPQIILGPNSTTGLSVGEDVASSVLKSFVKPNDECSDAEVSLESLEQLDDLVTAQCQSNTNGNNEKIFQNTYWFLISTVVGIIMVVLLVLVSIDVAMRLIKLSILQIIAPIPIMTYIDPKSSKDGAFSNWTKECINSYVSLFVQLAVIYFIVYLLQSIMGTAGSGQIIDWGSGADNVIEQGWVGIFIVIAAFFFMKQAPKYILKILGIKGGAMLGVGLSTGLAGLGGIIGGGGLLGAGAAALGAMSEGVEANFDGKSAFEKGGLKKGREIAANFTGNEKAKPLVSKVTDTMKARKASAKYGINDETLEEAKNARNYANSRLDFANSLLEQAVQNGEDIMWDGKKYTAEEFRSNVIYGGEENLAVQVKKLSSRYDDMNAFAKSMGIKKANETFPEKYKAAKKEGKDDYNYIKDVTANQYKKPPAELVAHMNKNEQVNKPQFFVDDGSFYDSNNPED